MGRISGYLISRFPLRSINVPVLLRSRLITTQLAKYCVINLIQNAHLIAFKLRFLIDSCRNLHLPERFEVLRPFASKGDRVSEIATTSLFYTFKGRKLGNSG